MYHFIKKNSLSRCFSMLKRKFPPLSLFYVKKIRHYADTPHDRCLPFPVTHSATVVHDSARNGMSGCLQGENSLTPFAWRLHCIGKIQHIRHGCAVYNYHL